MWLDYLIAAAVIFTLIVGWVAVQAAARRFADRHPELGPAKEEGGGCGHGGCGGCAIAELCARGR